MNLEELAAKSPYGTVKWEDADRVLLTADFDEEDRGIILQAAAKNRLHPVRFARAAVSLRDHVEGGKPLS